jgi:hypothetical protein
MHNYPWQDSYVKAALETDSSLMKLRIYKALSAIEQRRLSPVEPDSSDDRALKIADDRIHTLIADTVARGKMA